jgi:hypothetical protein
MLDGQRGGGALLRRGRERSRRRAGRSAGVHCQSDRARRADDAKCSPWYPSACDDRFGDRHLEGECIAVLRRFVAGRETATCVAPHASAASHTSMPIEAMCCTSTG